MRLDGIYNFALLAKKYVMATSLDLPAPTLAVLQTIVDNAGAHFGPTKHASPNLQPPICISKRGISSLFVVSFVVVYHPRQGGRIQGAFYTEI